jgi:ribosomal protein S18 acetylase RimI-like enzyme
MNDYLCWKKMKSGDTAGVELLLREREKDCVGACGRFIDRNSLKSQVWTLRGNEGGLSALILHSKSSLMPVLCGKKEIPSPLFLRSLLRGIKLHSVQGLREEVIVLEKELEQLGRKTGDIFDYDLMCLDKPPDPAGYSKGPVNLITRAPQLADLDAVAALQAAYEQEEVLPKGSVFSPLSSRTNTASIITKSHILAAELDGQLVGKININAVSFTRYQVGGVYVHPSFRGLGIASRMAAEFIGSLILQSRGVTLFVRKTNLAARKLYAGLGFSVRGDYRISYY